jgi:SacI restriction endonuclease
MPLDYDKAGKLLAELFLQAERAFQDIQAPEVTKPITQSMNALFSSSTQSYREVLLGCGLARILDSSINIRHPYVNQGTDSFNGRTLDEKVINPFLHDRLIPCSKGPYLASFRRNVKFNAETARGLRDKVGYDALLKILDTLEKSSTAEAKLLIRYLLYRFVELRNASRVSLSKISRLSLDQFDALLTDLLRAQSGGLIPVLLVIAMLRTINSCFNLKWEIAFQGINVSDKASGAGGDITVLKAGEIVLAIEVTERPIGKSRVVSTFNTKVMHVGIQDYLFVYSNATPSDDARTAARTYFSQGHEINFVQIKEWILNNLATLGSRCRSTFTKEMLALLDGRDISASLKLVWNDSVRKLVSD